MPAADRLAGAPANNLTLTVTADAPGITDRSDFDRLLARGQMFGARPHPDLRLRHEDNIPLTFDTCVHR